MVFQLMEHVAGRLHSDSSCEPITGGLTTFRQVVVSSSSHDGGNILVHRETEHTVF